MSPPMAHKMKGFHGDQGALNEIPPHTTFDTIMSRYFFILDA